jgi:hypothetical protein
MPFFMAQSPQLCGRTSKIKDVFINGTFTGTLNYYSSPTTTSLKRFSIVTCMLLRTRMRFVQGLMGFEDQAASRSLMCIRIQVRHHQP